MSLIVNNIIVNIGDKEIIKEASFEIKSGQIVALEGPNGSGKSTLAWALAGFQDYKITADKVTLDNVDLLKMTPDLRSKAGLFVSFQNPVALPNITVAEFLKTAFRELCFPKCSLEDFADSLEKWLLYLKLPVTFLDRIMNEDFSGGEKKKLEVLQILLFKPKYVVLDEVDSGVDKESLETVASIVKMLAKEDKTGFLIISHYARFLEMVSPQKVLHINAGKLS